MEKSIENYDIKKYNFIFDKEMRNRQLQFTNDYLHQQQLQICAQ